MASSNAPMITQQFLAQVNNVRADLQTYASYITSISECQQHLLSSPELGPSSELQTLTANAQALGRTIKDQILALEQDAGLSPEDTVKQTQLRQLKRQFAERLQQYQLAESRYESQYREQITRSYRIINPDASEEEAQRAADTDWGNEGVFKTALKSSRTTQKQGILVSVRARHAHIQRIEQTMVELSTLFQQMHHEIESTEAPAAALDAATAGVVHDIEKGNKDMDEAHDHAVNVRKLKWWMFGIVILVLLVLGLILGIILGLKYGKK